MEASEENTKKEAMASTEANGLEAAEAAQEGTSNLENSEIKNGDSLSVCRDFMRNVCTRGKRCKYAHPESKGETNNAATLLQVRHLQLDPLAFPRIFPRLKRIQQEVKKKIRQIMTGQYFQTMFKCVWTRIDKI